MARGLALKPPNRLSASGARINPGPRDVPGVFYHGYDASRGLRTSFRPTSSRRSVGGLPREVTSPSFFFSPSLAFATAFAAARFAPSDAAVAAAVLRVRHPLDLTIRRADLADALRDTTALDRWGDIPSKRERWQLLDDPGFVQGVRDAGYDSAIADETDLAGMLGVAEPEASMSWAVFDPSRIQVIDPSVSIRSLEVSGGRKVRGR